jgi:hypothetical protein
MSETGLKKKTNRKSWGVVSHSCNPSYLRSKDQEGQSSRPAWAKN